MSKIRILHPTMLELLFSQKTLWKQCNLTVSVFCAFGVFFLSTVDTQASSPAQTSIQNGRASLSLQTPAGLQSALSHFNSALVSEPNNLEANLLKAATILVLEQNSLEFRQQLESVGIEISNPSIYEFEYQLPVDPDGIFQPTAGVYSNSTIAYFVAKEGLIDQALACLAKFGNDQTSRAFRINLSASETSLADTRVDYGDVLILRALLKASKAGLALVKSYNLNGEYALVYRLLTAGELTPQKVLEELPDLLKFADQSRRTDAVNAIISANSDYQTGYGFTKSQRLPAGLTPYLFEFTDTAAADDFASELSSIVGSLAAHSEISLYQDFYPSFLQGLTANSSAFFATSTPLRSFFPTGFVQGFPTRNSWPDEGFGGALPEAYSRGVLLDELDLVLGEFIDTDGDGLSDSWERGYGRYEIVSGEYTKEWATNEASYRGGHLATFTTSGEWDWFWKRHWRDIDGFYYIGLGSNGAQPAEWSWDTGESGSFRNWKAGEPVDNGSNVSAVVDPSLEWETRRLFAGYQWQPPDYQMTVDMPLEPIGYILERGYPTDHTKADTDGDGFDDGVETKIGTDPNNAAQFPNGPDMDGDGINNYREAIDFTDPLDPASFSALSFGLVAALPFSGNANDESGFGHPTTTFNLTPTQDRFGLPNRAFDFDGATSWIGASVNLFNYGDGATFSAWVKIPEGSSPGAIISQPWDNITVAMRLGVQDGLPNGAVYSPNYHWQPMTSVLSPFAPARNSWNHIVLVNEGWVLRLYVNGQEVSSSYGQTYGASSLQDILVGKEFPASGGSNGAGYFLGSIDDVRVYNRSLYSHEIAELYAAESAPLPDSDGDGLPDLVETNTGNFVSNNNTGTNPNNSDTDGDGLSDGVESNTGIFEGPSDAGSNPNDPDTNGDGVEDGEAVAGGFGPIVDLAPSIAWFHGLVDAQPGRFGLMTTEAVMDLNVGQMMIQKTGNNVSLQMQLQTSVDLSTQPFTNHGDPITTSISMPGNKGFLRVRVSGQQPSPQ